MAKNTPEIFPAQKYSSFSLMKSFPLKSNLKKYLLQQGYESKNKNTITTNKQTHVCLVFFVFEVGNVTTLLDPTVNSWVCFARPLLKLVQQDEVLAT